MTRRQPRRGSRRTPKAGVGFITRAPELRVVRTQPVVLSVRRPARFGPA